MPVTAHIPIRIRIDPALAGGDVSGAVRGAVAAAVGRSLRAFEEDVLEERGGYARPGFRVPQFAWGGQPVSADWRQAIEQACNDEIAALTRPIAERVDERLRLAPQVAPHDPYERIDPSRIDGLTYRIPSYDGDTPSPDQAVFFDSPDLAVQQVPTGYHADWWEWDGQNDAALHLAFHDIMVQRYGTKGHPSRVGFMYWNRTTDQFEISFLHKVTLTKYSEDNIYIAGQIYDRMAIGAKSVFLGDNNVVGNDDTGLRPFGKYEIHKWKDVSGPDHTAEALKDLYLALRKIPATKPGGETDKVTSERIAIETFARTLADDPKNSGVRVIYALVGSSGYAILLRTRVYDVLNLEILPIGAYQRGALSDEAGEGRANRIRSGGDEGGEGGGNGDSSGDGTNGPGGASDEGLEGDSAKFSYPASYGATTLTLDLSPFLGEPSLDQLGSLGERMRRLIRRIAFRLDMPEGEYCGAFLIAAAQVMGAHATGIADLGEVSPETTKVTPAGTGNLGTMDMQPQITPTVQLMRYVCGTCPLIHELSELMGSVYEEPSVRKLITGFRHNDPGGWMLEFYKEHSPIMGWSVAWIYVRTCQLMMLQLLRASHEEIVTRLTGFAGYFPRAAALIKHLLGGEADMMRMREMLQSLTMFTSGRSVLASVAQSWRDARRVFTTSLSSQTLNLAAVTSPGRLLETKGAPELTEEGWRIRDGERLWSLEELESEIAMRHQFAQSIDPLIQQFVDIPAVAATFRDSPELAETYLRNLLKEMKDNNEDIEKRTRSDNMFAFRSGAISEDMPHRTVPGTSIAMRGIHLLAHEAIGDSFGGSHWYAVGLNHAFGSELGRQSILAFTETVGTLVLCVVCPPLGVAAGIAIAANEVHNASIKEDLYGSLIDPEILMTRAEVEFEMFMAQFGLALAIIPDLGAIMGAGKRLAGAGARAGLRGISRTVRRQLLVAFGRQVTEGLAKKFVEAVLIDQVMRLMMPRLLGPVLVEVEREIKVMSGELPPPDHPSKPAAATEAPKSLTPDEAELIQRIEEYQEGDRADEELPPASEAP